MAKPLSDPYSYRGRNEAPGKYVRAEVTPGTDKPRKGATTRQSSEIRPTAKRPKRG